MLSHNRFIAYFYLLPLILFGGMISSHPKASDTGTRTKFEADWQRKPIIQKGWKVLDKKSADVNGDGKIEYIYLITDNRNDMVIVAENVNKEYWRYQIVISVPVIEHIKYYKKLSNQNKGKGKMVLTVLHDKSFGYAFYQTDPIFIFKWNENKKIYEIFTFTL